MDSAFVKAAPCRIKKFFGLCVIGHGDDVVEDTGAAHSAEDLKKHKKGEIHKPEGEDVGTGTVNPHPQHDGPASHVEARALVIEKSLLGGFGRQVAVDAPARRARAPRCDPLRIGSSGNSTHALPRLRCPPLERAENREINERERKKKRAH